MNTATQTIPDGYKLTEVGIIPNDWKIFPISKTTKEIFLGLTSKVDYVTNNGIPLIRASDIAKGRLEFSNAKTISKRQHLLLTKFRKPKKDDILVSKSGSLGVCAKVDSDREFSIYESIIVLQPNQFIKSDYLLWLLRSDQTQERMVGEKVGSSVGHLNIETFRILDIPVPELTEQNAISIKLQEIENLIQKTEKLIVKKKATKQGVTQVLLTGQIRLPGFNGQWKERKLGEISKIDSGINKPLSFIGKGGAKYITVMELYEGSKILTENAGRIDVSNEEITTYSLKSGDIVFGKSSVKRDGIGYPNIFVDYKEPVVFSGFTFRSRVNRELSDPFFIIHILRSNRIRNWLINNSQASALTNINQDIANNIPMYIPLDVKEQTAIAVILSDMDSEIEKLEKKLEKYNQIKQGAMQVLLTGKIRLIKN